VKYRGRVLVIEDEETLRENIVRALSKLEHVSVVGAGTIAEALQHIDAAAPDVVLSDLDLPDRPGVELIGELGKRSIRCPVVFVSAYTRAFAAQIPRHANVRVIDKPAPLETLRTIVREHLEKLAAEHEEQGAPFGVADYLQLACMGQHSVLIQVAHEDPPARIVVYRGALWSAQDSMGSGEEAFRRLAFEHGPEVTVCSLKEDPGPRNIERGWEALLIDVAREHDEESQEMFSEALLSGEELSLSLPPPTKSQNPAPVAAVVDSSAGSFEAAYERGIAALLTRDYPTAVKAFREAEAIVPGDRMVAANLKRLRDLGFAGEDN
jgi:CheY-like chemotaxis protein